VSNRLRQEGNGEDTSRKPSSEETLKTHA